MPHTGWNFSVVDPKVYTMVHRHTLAARPCASRFDHCCLKQSKSCDHTRSSELRESEREREKNLWNSSFIGSKQNTRQSPFVLFVNLQELCAQEITQTSTYHCWSRNSKVESKNQHDDDVNLDKTVGVTWQKSISSICLCLTFPQEISLLHSDKFCSPPFSVVEIKVHPKTTETRPKIILCSSQLKGAWKLLKKWLLFAPKPIWFNFFDSKFTTPT